MRSIDKVAEEIVEIIWADFIEGRGCEIRRREAREYVADELEEFLKNYQEMWEKLYWGGIYY